MVTPILATAAQSTLARCAALRFTICWLGAHQSWTRHIWSCVLSLLDRREDAWRRGGDGGRGRGRRRAPFTAGARCVPLIRASISRACVCVVGWGFHPSVHQSHVRACVWLGGGFILSSLHFCPPCTACHMTDGGFILSSRSVLAIFFFISAHRAPPVT